MTRALNLHKPQSAGRQAAHIVLYAVLYVATTPSHLSSHSNHMVAEANKREEKFASAKTSTSVQNERSFPLPPPSSFGCALRLAKFWRKKHAARMRTLCERARAHTAATAAVAAVVGRRSLDLRKADSGDCRRAAALRRPLQCNEHLRRLQPASRLTCSA